jgi:hypothetical protein
MNIVMAQCIVCDSDCWVMEHDVSVCEVNGETLRSASDFMPCSTDFVQNACSLASLVVNSPVLTLSSQCTSVCQAPVGLMSLANIS